MNDSYLTITRSNSIFIMVFMACLAASKLIAVPINSINVKDFIYPYFVVEGNGVKDEISTMPGIYRFSIYMDI